MSGGYCRRASCPTPQPVTYVRSEPFSTAWERTAPSSSVKSTRVRTAHRSGLLVQRRSEKSRSFRSGQIVSSRSRANYLYLVFWPWASPSSTWRTSGGLTSVTATSPTTGVRPEDRSALNWSHACSRSSTATADTTAPIYSRYSRATPSGNTVHCSTATTGTSACYQPGLACHRSSRPTPPAIPGPAWPIRTASPWPSSPRVSDIAVR